jgi:SWI/SNF-related matrix-associated actin-dependent regulator of chromatin subfamily A member 5
MRLGETPRLLLTGTPLQNSHAELFALLHFVAPALYDDAEGFASWVGEAQSGGDGDGPSGPAGRLWRPLMLRRLKREHLKLPPKRELVVGVPLTALQRTWYRNVLQRNRAALGAANAHGLVNVLASLRKCCNHPCVEMRGSHSQSRRG